MVSGNMEDLTETYMTTSQMAAVLGIHPKAANLLVRNGTVKAVKIANRWLIRRTEVKELAKTYVGRPGRPKTSDQVRKGHGQDADGTV